ncbi:MAG: putative DNA-binding domain-containing protein [Candidatus Eiseniibacteriota bacterium]
MSTLRSIQAQFRAASLKGAAPALAAVVVAGGIDPARRLQIHRNHLRTTLTDALAATFPTVEALVGAEFFRTLARDFIAVEPPGAPCLFEYGATLPNFIAVHPACRSLPYLADAARFDWQINVAYHAPDRPRLERDRLAALTPDLFSRVVLVPHPATQLLTSPYPLLDIWRLARAQGAGPTVDLDAGGVRLLVHRTDLDVGWRALTIAEYVFLDSLVQGVPLARAWDNALTFDLTGAETERFIQTAFNLDLFTDLTLAAPAADPDASTERTSS